MKLKLIIVFSVIVFSVIGIIIYIANIKKENDIKENDEILYIESYTKIKNKRIKLDRYDTDLLIVDSGTYYVNGTLNHSIFINTNETITLKLDNVSISGNKTAAIVNIGKNDLIIDLIDNSTNVLSDGKEDTKYDGCIFSYGHIIIDGKGKLEISGNQIDGEGIATKYAPITINNGNININANDDGLNTGKTGGTITINNGLIRINAGGDGIDSNQDIKINGGTSFITSKSNADSGIDAETGIYVNGGTLVSIGSRLTIPSNLSRQTTLCITLNNYVNSNKTVSLIDSVDKEIISFKSIQKFRSLIISTPTLTEGEYTLYSGGSHTGNLKNNIYFNGDYLPGTPITINNNTSINVKNGLNTYLSKIR